MAGPIDNWDAIAGWWREEVASDPVYREDVAPMLSRLMRATADPVLDLGCGDGRWLRWLEPRGRIAVGCDRSLALLADAATGHPVAMCDLPSLAWVRGGSIGTALSVFVLDLVEEFEPFFSETHRIVESGGGLVVVVNHPVFTAPRSGPFMDQDLDVFWRWGDYLERGADIVPAGDRDVQMFHRSIADLLTVAADAGWCLDEMIEAPLGSAAIEREPSYAGQEGVPRFLGVRWNR